MYCRNCGTELGFKEERCKKCDYVRGFGADYCPDCGTATSARAKKCPECGATLFILRNAKPRSRFVTALLAFTVGVFGIHNFYLGYMRRALLQIILSVVGLIFIPILPGPFTASLPIFVWLWATIEGVQLVIGNTRVDADGNFLT